jgi:O-acetyl-ADP-ribose deacetylase (regulator of RNase III)
MEIEVVAGDITRFSADAIVNSANPSLLAGSGVCGAIHRVAGSQLEAACLSLGPIKPGAAVITQAFNLPAKWVIHAVGPRWLGGKQNEEDVLAMCYQNIIQRGEEVHAVHLSVPSISTGIYRFPLALASKIVISTLKSTTSRSIQRISLICMDQETEREYQKAITEILPQ